jgi:hypothetical protein
MGACKQSLHLSCTFFAHPSPPLCRQANSHCVPASRTSYHCRQANHLLLPACQQASHLLLASKPPLACKHTPALASKQTICCWQANLLPLPERRPPDAGKHTRHCCLQAGKHASIQVLLLCWRHPISNGCLPSSRSRAPTQAPADYAHGSAHGLPHGLAPHMKCCT